MNFIKKKNFIYIAEFSLPNKSAYTVHVLKMCGSATKNDYNVKLYLPFIDKDYKKNVFNDFILKKKFHIISVFKRKWKLNFILRMLFSILVANKLKKINDKVVISRSIITSIFLAIFQVKNILEIHTEISGFTRYIFFLKKISFIKKNLKFITLNKILQKKLNLEKRKTIILNDAVNFDDFKYKPKKILSRTCVYTGSFAEGKGVENIIRIAKIVPNIKFHLYGNLNTSNDPNLKNKFSKNIKFMGYIPYKKVGKVLSNYKVVIMPYSSKVGVLMRNIFVQNYFSPLKMFEYMASGKIIIASKLNVYEHILKNNYNSILIKKNNFRAWKENLLKVFNSNNFLHLGRNAKRDVKKYTWDLRLKKIINFNEK